MAMGLLLGGGVYLLLSREITASPAFTRFFGDSYVRKWEMKLDLAWSSVSLYRDLMLCIVSHIHKLRF